MAKILSGGPATAALTENLAARAEALKKKGVCPTLAILRVGDNESDLSYERSVMKRCEKVGIAVRHIVLPADVAQERLLDEIAKINADDGVHGCLIYRPLPEQMKKHLVCNALDVRKDVDGMTDRSLASVFVGKGEGYASCTAQACIEILDYYGIELTGAKVAVIGRSLVSGKPVSMLLQNRNATVTMCHTKTVDIRSICREADILVVAAGRARLIDASYTRPGQVIIDVGINVDENGKLCGDVDFDAVEPCVGAITPVPGGVGSMTAVVLCKNVILSAESMEDTQA